MSSYPNSPVPSFPAAGLIPLRLRRLAILFAIPLLLAVLISARLVQFHVFLHRNQDTSSFVDRNLTEIATRGVIVDARGDLLVGDVWTYRFVVPHLENLSPLYRESLGLLLAGVGQVPRSELTGVINRALDSFNERMAAERDRSARIGQKPTPIFAYVVLDRDLHLVQGQYLEELQRRGVQAANLWDLYQTGHDNAYESLQKIMQEESIALGIAGPSLARVMSDLGLRADLEGQETDFEFFRSFRLEPSPSRYYTQGSLGSHVLGLVNADRDGVNGLESYYQRFLRGEVQILDKTRSLGALTPEARRYIPSHMGGDLMLTIDKSIQHIVEQELKIAIEKYNVQQGGTIIVLDPPTGGVLAMANLPNFHPGALDEAPADPNAFTNLAVTGVYEPGSVFKVLTMAAALDLGVIQPQEQFFDVGRYEVVPEAVIKNSEGRILGRVSATEALAFSLNTIIAEIALERIGPSDFYDYLFNFGLGEVSGIDLAHEFNGSLKDKYPGTVNWNITDLGTNSFGQGLNLTPIQMVNAINTVANGGTLMKPYVVQHRVLEEGVLTFAPTVLQTNVISAETSDTVAEMMTFTVNQATVGAQVPGFRVAGKSGTAQVPDPDRIGVYSEDVVISSFVGFAPADDPRFVILIKFNDPHSVDGFPVWGALNAAPTFGRIAERILDYMNVPPSCHPECYASPVRQPDTGPSNPGGFELPAPEEAQA